MTGNTLLDPTTDGTTHVNVYSRGKTPLGRLLTNFAHTPIQHPEHGTFQSLEGYWYWLSTGKCHQPLRGVWGYRAKALGKTFSRVQNVNFMAEFCAGLELKLKQNPEVRELLLGCDLPLTHYYVYGEPPNHKVVDAKQAAWVTAWYVNWRASAKELLPQVQEYVIDWSDVD